MAKRRKLKSIFLVFMVMLTLCVGTATCSYAATDDNISFSLGVKALQANSYTGQEKRSTTNPKNSWKVDFNSSSETKGTVSTFWLVNTSHSAVSAKQDIKVGAAPLYSPAYSSANNTYVQLAVENNTNTTESYSVKGYWDEETGVILGN
ncbi:MAG: DUF2712 domain-containing protein [Clostridiales bacterium]|nr:DUF2712 domain-containing protein [Clostridiales bacterium]